ncbi:hypothetical protein KL925_002234 [Ogataea polymorpha]|uniref:Uncharacterized protein n=1 Tax=Ogataea polymorpha TaxID=460523 RepID=A0A9P8TCQ7_9ASCO|nr:hypothetical protein KL936_002061 [Ogataea polymorpha]KAG7910912.1 hypothetical protein KL906_001292 [Ogataea polymorpha]KAG7918541.1 hypothetical protein KL927_001998 [Ogataea polymorpha]KAG7927876.1 hypothetical protein KL925_002234 [Ogataea polymorpha]KAH3673939.1 hypothetical protein OGATHE_001919 [Ogataea polymorpha]
MDKAGAGELFSDDQEMLEALRSFLVRKNARIRRQTGELRGDLVEQVRQQRHEIIQLRNKCRMLEEKLRAYDQGTPKHNILVSPKKNQLSPLKAQQHSPTYSALSGTETEDSEFSTPRKLRLVSTAALVSVNPAKDDSILDDCDEESLKVLKQSSSQQPRDKIREMAVLDLTCHPGRKGNWWPEDFKPNPETNFGQREAFTLRRINPKYAHPALQTQHKYQQQHLKQEAMKEFNRLAGQVEPVTPGVKLVWSANDTGTLPTPLKTPDQALSNPKIDPVFKFEINKYNYKNFDLNLNSNKIKLWLDLQDSPPGHERSEFPTPSQSEADRQKSIKRAKLVALQRLFQTVFMVQPTDKSGTSYQQVGKFIFRNDEWNQLVRRNEFQIDESIFYNAE